MKKMIATHELTLGELRQIDKQQAQKRRQMRFKDRMTGEQRIRPIVKRELPEDDEDLAGIDLRRIKSLSDLNLE